MTTIEHLRESNTRISRWWMRRKGVRLLTGQLNPSSIDHGIVTSNVLCKMYAAFDSVGWGGGGRLEEEERLVKEKTAWMMEWWRKCNRIGRVTSRDEFGCVRTNRSSRALRKLIGSAYGRRLFANIGRPTLSQGKKLAHVSRTKLCMIHLVKAS